MKILLLLIPLLFIICFSPAYGDLIDTKVYDVELNSTHNALYNFEFGPNGNHAYFSFGPENYNSVTPVVLTHYTLDTPYNVASRNEVSRLTFPEHGDQNANGIMDPYSFSISDDGRFLYVFSFSDNRANNGDERILQYRLAEPFILSTAEFVRNIDYAATGNRHILHVDFSPSGTVMYVGDFYSHNLSQYNLDSPYEISFNRLTTVIHTVTTFLISELSHDGNLLFIDNYPHTFRTYNLDTPFQLSSRNNGTAIIPDLPANQTSLFLSDFHWYNNGFNLFIKSSSSSSLFQYEFNRPYDIRNIPLEPNTEIISIPQVPIVSNNATEVQRSNPVISSSSVIPLSSEPQGSGGCSGDCTYPTMGLDKNGRRLVDNGFSYNGNTVDVIPWHTPYPLITTKTHEFNEMIITAWDNNGIKLMNIGLGMPEIGLPTNDAEILIEVWFEQYTGVIEELKIIDSHDLIKYPLFAVKSKMINCRADNDEQCVSLTVNYVYDDIPKYNIVKIDVMDYSKNVQSFYINDGVAIFGTVITNNPDTMMTSPPANHPDKYQVKLFKVSNTNDLWRDKYGYLWLGDESKITFIDNIPFIRNQDKQSNFGSQDRYNSNFEKVMNYEKQRAQKIFEELYGN